MKSLPFSKNVGYIVGWIGVMFLALVAAAVYVGILEGGYGCGGGTVGAIIALGGVVIGFLAGLAVKFADGFGSRKNKKPDAKPA